MENGPAKWPFIAIYSQHFSLSQIPVKFRNIASIVGIALVFQSDPENHYVGAKIWRVLRVPGLFQITIRPSIAKFCSCLLRLRRSFVTIGVYFDAKDGMPERLAIPENIQSSLSYQGNDCSQKDYVHIREDWYCKLGASDTEPGFLIFGDSHLDSIFPAFDRAAKNSGARWRYSGQHKRTR